MRPVSQGGIATMAYLPAAAGGGKKVLVRKGVGVGQHVSPLTSTTKQHTAAEPFN